MKRKVSLLLAVLLLVSAVCALAACSTSYVKIAIKEGTLQTTVEFGGEVDYTKLVIIATDSDGKTAEINAYTDGALTSGVKLDKIDTSTSGAKTFKVSYYGLTAQQVITVGDKQVDEDTITVISMENTAGYKAYLNNSVEQSNKDEQFVSLGKPYMVGSANGYKCAPLVTYDDGEKTDVSENMKTVYKLYKKGETTPLSGDALTAVLRKVDNNIYYFTEDAEGKEFTLEISVDPQYEVLEEDDVTVTQNIMVVSGYNVHDALDLSVMDNLNNKSWAAIKKTVRDWNEGKTLAEYKDVERVILHKEITVKKSDLPTNYFWQEGEGKQGDGISYADAYARTPSTYKDLLKGSLKETCLGEDWENGEHNNQRGLYTSNGIGLAGNYMTLTYDPGYTEIKDENGKTTKVTAEDGGIYIVCDFNMDAGNTKTYPEVHISMFAYRNHKDNTRTPVIENVYLTGKTNKTESGIGIVPAGLMMSNVNIDNATISNVVANRWFCNIETDGTVTADKAGTLVNVADCKFFDSFSQMIYILYGRGINITNCEMRGAGGPLVIVQTKGKDAPKYVTGGSYVKIDDMSKMESWITGDEVWFQINNVPSATVTQLFALAGNVDTTGTKFRKVVKSDQDAETVYYNVIAVLIPAPSKLNDADVALEGKFDVVTDTATDAYGTDEAVFNAILDLSSNASKAATLCNDLVSSLGDQLGSNKATLEQAAVGFGQLSAATAALQFAPLYKCGNLYAYGGLTDKGTFTFNNVKDIVTSGTQLCNVMEQIANVLQSNIDTLNEAAKQYRAAGDTATAAQYEAQAAALKAKKDEAQAIYSGARALTTVTAQEDADWSAAWKANTQHFVGVYVRPNIDASKNNFGRLVAIFAENLAA